MDKITMLEDKLFEEYRKQLNNYIEEENEKEVNKIIRKMSMLLN